MSRLRELLRNPRNQRIAAVVGVVLVAIIAGVTFAAISSPRAVGDASPSQSPSASPEPTRSPGPSASEPEPTVEPTPTPTPPALAGDRPFAATVLVNDLNVRELPGDGTPLTMLDAGSVVLMYGEVEEIDGIDWYGVTAPSSDEQIYGWVSAGPDEDPYLELHYRLAQQLPATIEEMAGSDAGYLAWGANPRVSTEQPTRFIAASADGGTWQLSDAPGSVNTASFVFAAYGPSGWLLITSDELNSGPGELWRSGDGVTWEQVALDLPDDVVPNGLVGFADGFALAARDDRSGTSAGALYVSSDGSEWEELTGDSLPYGFSLHALDDGFIAAGQVVDEVRFVVRSGDAHGWTSPEDRGLPGAEPRVVSIGDNVIAVAPAPSLGPMQAWRSSLDLATWERVPQLESILEDIAISHLVAGDESILLSGKQYSDGAEQWWRSSDGLVWERITPTGINLDALSGPMTAGATGFSAAASELTAAGSNPRFLITLDGLAWTAVSDPALPIVESAVVGSCPAAPATMLEWKAVPGAVGAECFGSTPVTFAAWNTVGGGCGGYAPGRFEPEWLASPFAMFALVITPMEVPAGACGDAAIPPGTSVPEPQQWIEVTGHWADPASADCQWIPQPDFPYVGYGDLEGQCRATFVATSVVPTDAP